MANSGYYWVHCEANEVGRKASASLSLPSASSIVLNGQEPYAPHKVAMYAMFGFGGIFDAGVYYHDGSFYLFAQGGENVPWQTGGPYNFGGQSGTLTVEPKADGTIVISFGSTSWTYSNSSANALDTIKKVYNNGVKIGEEITWAFNPPGQTISYVLPNVYKMGLVSFGNATITRTNGTTFQLWSNCTHKGPYDANGGSLPSYVVKTLTTYSAKVDRCW